MSRETGLRSTASIGGHPIHAMLVQFPIVCFVGAFITDIIYWRSMSFIWETFSVWLLTAGLVGAGLAVIAGLVDFVGDRRIRQLRSAWIHALGNGLVIILSVITFSSIAATAIPRWSRRASFCPASSFSS